MRCCTPKVRPPDCLQVATRGEERMQGWWTILCGRYLSFIGLAFMAQTAA